MFACGVVKWGEERGGSKYRTTAAISNFSEFDVHQIAYFLPHLKQNIKAISEISEANLDFFRTGRGEGKFEQKYLFWSI